MRCVRNLVLGLPFLQPCQFKQLFLGTSSRSFAPKATDQSTFDSLPINLVTVPLTQLAVTSSQSHVYSLNDSRLLPTHVKQFSLLKQFLLPSI